MALSPIKPKDDLVFESSSLTDSGLPITTISSSDLSTFLEGVTGDVTFYFAAGTGTNVHLVLAENVAGTISTTKVLESGTLPCPNYCG